MSFFHMGYLVNIRIIDYLNEYGDKSLNVLPSLNLVAFKINVLFK